MDFTNHQLAAAGRLAAPVVEWAWLVKRQVVVVELGGGGAAGVALLALNPRLPRLAGRLAGLHTTRAVAALLTQPTVVPTQRLSFSTNRFR